MHRQPVFPASYDLDNVVSVAAISRNGQLAPFSSYGKKQVDVAAPGSNIMTTSAKKSYRSVSGTSFAVPMVTGTIALLWTRLPQLNYRQVIQRLLESVKKNPHLEGKWINTILGMIKPRRKPYYAYWKRPKNDRQACDQH